ncbi:outer membrane protein [Paraliomyxa miuraensis]|uniref:outer membrane protein n=1 Tax=Paraliomyxa miuraensis TaxID=376150 RepID=UPI0022549F30|nr:hypothetical protein [Paraliomyxa miuraensis]MCX4246022.1 hypothetical protein [Paraliomyxa miuraensis]
MRPTASLLPISAALLALTATTPALAGEGDGTTVVSESVEDGPVKVVVETDADGDTTKTTVIEEADGEAVVKVVEKVEDGQTKKVVKITDGDQAVVIVESSDDDDDDEIVEEEIVEHHHHHRHRDIKWLGLHGGLVFNPGGSNGRVSSGDGRLRQNQFKACADPAGQTACGYVKGLDLKVQMFETDSAWRYPHFIGYFRTGFEQGRVVFEPGEGGIGPGQATRLDYTSVPLFLGGSLYLFDEFPVRPYAGLGFGFDVLRLDYRRAEAARTVDASARIGFELHAGLEVRISNYISLNAEVMQLWSARRKMPSLPDYSNTGLSVLAGVTVGIPVRLDRRNEDHDEHHHTVKKVRRVKD